MQGKRSKNRALYRTPGCDYSIYWRVADAIPLVASATFLDFLMIITCASLVIVLVSGILIMKFTEMKDTAKVYFVCSGSVRIIPPLSITLYIILFIAFLRQGRPDYLIRILKKRDEDKKGNWSGFLLFEEIPAGTGRND